VKRNLHMCGTEHPAPRPAQRVGSPHPRSPRHSRLSPRPATPAPSPALSRHSRLPPRPATPAPSHVAVTPFPALSATRHIGSITRAVTPSGPSPRPDVGSITRAWWCRCRHQMHRRPRPGPSRVSLASVLSPASARAAFEALAPVCHHARPRGEPFGAPRPRSTRAIPANRGRVGSELLSARTSGRGGRHRALRVIAALGPPVDHAGELWQTLQPPLRYRRNGTADRVDLAIPRCPAQRLQPP
jgi:hypothetical protein